MLNNIPKILPSELVKCMMDMGHGDTILLADAHYPAHTYGKKVIPCPGVNNSDLLDAILQLMPLDTYVKSPVSLMQVVEGDQIGTPGIWSDFTEILRKHGINTPPKMVERFDFYEESKNAYIIVQSGDTAQYANIVLKKGIVK